MVPRPLLGQDHDQGQRPLLLPRAVEPRSDPDASQRRRPRHRRDRGRYRPFPRLHPGRHDAHGDHVGREPRAQPAPRHQGHLRRRTHLRAHADGHRHRRRDHLLGTVLRTRLRTALLRSAGLRRLPREQGGQGHHRPDPGILGQLRRLHDLQDHPRDHVHRGDRRADRGRRGWRGLHPRARHGDAPAPRAGSPLLLRQPDRPALRERDRARLRRERGHPASRHRHGSRFGVCEGGGERHLHRRRLGPPGRHHPVVPRPQGRDRRNGDPGCHESHVHADDDARR